MFAARLLSVIAIMLTLIGVAIVTGLDSTVGLFDAVGRLNAVEAQHQALANGLFMLAGVFWVGVADTTRKMIEPVKLDTIVRFSLIAFAAHYLLGVVFPCDSGCLAVGSVNQWLNSTLVWVLYCGPVVFALRLQRIGSSLVIRRIALLLVLIFVVMQIDTAIWQVAAGLWQRLYELLFCLLWWQYMSGLIKRP